MRIWIFSPLTLGYGLPTMIKSMFIGPDLHPVACVQKMLKMCSLYVHYVQNQRDSLIYLDEQRLPGNTRGWEKNDLQSRQVKVIG